MGLKEKFWLSITKYIRSSLTRPVYVVAVISSFLLTFVGFLTVFHGVKQFLDTTVISFYIAFSIQALFFITSWQIAFNKKKLLIVLIWIVCMLFSMFFSYASFYKTLRQNTQTPNTQTPKILLSSILDKEKKILFEVLDKNPVTNLVGINDIDDAVMKYKTVSNSCSIKDSDKTTRVIMYKCISKSSSPKKWKLTYQNILNKEKTDKETSTFKSSVISLMRGDIVAFLSLITSSILQLVILFSALIAMRELLAPANEDIPKDKPIDLTKYLPSFLNNIEVLLILIMTFLSLLWARNPTDNYEPYIVFVGALIFLVEVIRKRRG